MVKNSKKLIGVILILLVICIWVFSSEIIQYIFKNMNFKKPFFLTYFSTSLFSIYLLVLVISPYWREILKNMIKSYCFQTPKLDIKKDFESSPMKKEKSESNMELDEISKEEFNKEINEEIDEEEFNKEINEEKIKDNNEISVEVNSNIKVKEEKKVFY
jgi:hypothetical protein